MVEVNDFHDGEAAGPGRNLDDLIDPTMSDDDLILAARLDGPQPQDRVAPPLQDRIAPPRRSQTAPGWPPPPRVEHPKRLERAPNGIVGGVLAGLAYRLGVDTALMRVLFLIGACFSGGTLIPIYLILWGVLPEAGPNSALAQHERMRPRRRWFSRFFGISIAFVGAIWLLQILATWATFLVPIGFVALGVWLFWRDRDAAEEEDVPLPFSDSLDPLATSPDYERYIANKAKRLETQRRRRNTTIALTALIATTLTVVAVGGLFASDTHSVESVAIEDNSRLLDVPEPDADLNPYVGESQAIPYESESQSLVSVSKTSRLRNSYTISDGYLTIDLADAEFDQSHSLTIDARDSYVDIIVPPGANLDLGFELQDSSIDDSRQGEPDPLSGKALIIDVQGDDSNITIRDH